MIGTTGDTAAPGVTVAELGDTERHRLLSNEYRRAAIDVLAERARPTSLDALVAAVDDRLDSTDADHDSERELEILLHHKHLPMMASTGVVDYDHERRRVSP